MTQLDLSTFLGDQMDEDLEDIKKILQSNYESKGRSRSSFTKPSNVKMDTNQEFS